MKTDNELIAEFMGYSKEIQMGDAWCRDFDWNWSSLMPVVEKIQLYAHVKIENTQCLISVNGTLVTGIVNGNNIQNVYKAVVDFIKWYNSQTKEEKDA